MAVATSVRTRALAQPRMAAACLLGAIVVVSSLLRIALNWNTPAPWIFIDELIYSELGRSAFDGFAIRGIPVSGYGSVYPYLIAPAYSLFDNLVDAYRAVQVINAVIMSLTAIPAYLIARILMGRRWSLVAAALAVAIPAMTYSSVVMTESAFYPLYALAAMIVLYALRRGGVVLQVLVFVSALVCFETRPQGAVIVPAFALAIVLLALLECRVAVPGRRLSALVAELARFWLTWALLVVSIISIVGLQRHRGQPLSNLLGAYSIVADGGGGQYQAKPIISAFIQHLAEMDLWLGVLPVIALLVLLGYAVSRSGTREVRIYAAGAVALIVSMTAVVAAFAVFTNIGRVEERNLFYVGFLALTALCWWASQGLPRQARWFPIAVGIAVALPLLLPFGALINQSAVSDTFGLFLPWAIQNRLMDATLTAPIVLGGAVAAAVIAVIVRPRFAWLLVVATSAFFVVSGVAVDKRTDNASQGALAQGVSGAPDWIDRAVPPGTSVSVVYPGVLEPLKIWENEFFNRSVGSVYLIGVPMPASIPETVVIIDGQGNVTDRAGNPLTLPYVLSDGSVHLEGEVIATDAPRNMFVLRTHGTLRATESTTGVMGDQWSGAEFSYTRYRCSGGSVVLTLASDAHLHPTPITVTPYVGDAALPVITVPSTGTTTAVTKLAPAAGACAVRYVVAPTAVPALVFGAPDTRALGVLVLNVSYRP